jgi:hypothetical protein
MRDTSCGQSSLRTAMFTTVLILVGGVSAYDGYLVVRTGEMMTPIRGAPEWAGSSTAERTTDRRRSSLAVCKLVA